jgi:hypothetical protein
VETSFLTLACMHSTGISVNAAISFIWT